MYLRSKTYVQYISWTHIWSKVSYTPILAVTEIVLVNSRSTFYFTKRAEILIERLQNCGVANIFYTESAPNKVIDLKKLNLYLDERICLKGKPMEARGNVSCYWYSSNITKYLIKFNKFQCVVLGQQYIEKCLLR